MRSFTAFFLCATTAFAGYASKATISFATSGSTVENNITMAFSGADVKLRTIANGGEVQNTVTRVIATVPADFVLTSDPTCSVVTGGYTWGIESYDATNGTIAGWVKVPALAPGTIITATVCLGNVAVTGYQGGAQGAEFDSNTQGVWHYPDGTTLSAKDFSVSPHDGITTGATAAPGITGGAADFGGGAYIDIPQTAISGDTSVTFSAWVKTTNTARQFVLGSGVGVCGSNGFDSIEINSGGVLIRSDVSTAQTPTTVSDGNWHRLVGIYTPATLSIQVDNGTPSVSSGLSNPAIGSAAALEVGNLCTNFAGGVYAFTGSIDELFVSNVIRSSDWLETEYENQSGSPAITAFSDISGGAVSPPPPAPGNTGVTSQGFVF